MIKARDFYKGQYKQHERDEHIRNMDKASAIVDIVFNGETEQPRTVCYVLAAFIVEADGPIRPMMYTNTSKDIAELVVMRMAERITKDRTDKDKAETQGGLRP